MSYEENDKLTDDASEGLREDESWTPELLAIVRYVSDALMPPSTTPQVFREIVHLLAREILSGGFNSFCSVTRHFASGAMYDVRLTFDFDEFRAALTAATSEFLVHH